MSRTILTFPIKANQLARLLDWCMPGMASNSIILFGPICCLPEGQSSLEARANPQKLIAYRIPFCSLKCVSEHSCFMPQQRRKGKTVSNHHDKYLPPLTIVFDFHKLHSRGGSMTKKNKASILSRRIQNFLIVE